MSYLYSKSAQGFYSTDIHAADAIPDDVVVVTPAEHATLMAAQARGKVIVPGKGGKPVAVDPQSLLTGAEVLAGAQATAQAAVDAAVSAIRRAFISDLPGQEMIYQAKETEARAFLAASSPQIADYPFIAAEVGKTADTPDALVRLWLAMAAQWRAVAAQIEGARMTANAAIAAATTAEEAEDAVAVLQAAIASMHDNISS